MASMTDPVSGTVATAAVEPFSPAAARFKLSAPRLSSARPQLWVLSWTLGALLFTVVLQALSVTVSSASGNAVVDTATGLTGALACFVFVERLRATRQVRDLLSAVALGLLSSADLLLGACPLLLNASPGGSWEWGSVAVRLTALGVIVAAAFWRRVQVEQYRQLPRQALIVSVSALVAITAATLLWHSSLPAVLGHSGPVGKNGLYTHPPLLSDLQLVAALLAALAAFGFTRNSEREGDTLERSLAAGLAVLAVARLNYFLDPSLYLSRLYGGDILRLAAYALILHGCALEFRILQRKLIQRVAVDERRRMARDMHDGLAQELAFIATHTQRLNQSGEDHATVAHLRSAAERALHDSRTTIAVLTSPDDAPLDVLVARTAEAFRTRFGVGVSLDLASEVSVGAEQRNALLRILHESLNNAVRHGVARQIDVYMASGATGLSLTVTDDGAGFDVPAAVNAGKGLGLTSMRERTEMFNGSLSIASTPGKGTVVEVEFP
jgi:signal transduction histidine kinase